MSDYSISGSVKIGNLTIWTSPPPSDFKPAEGEWHIQLDVADPMYVAWQRAAAAQGLSRDEFLQTVAVAASGFAAADGKHEDPSAVAAHLAELAADKTLAGFPMTSDQAAAIGAALDQLESKTGAVTEAGLKRAVASPDYYDNPAKQKRVADGYKALEEMKGAPPAASPAETKAPATATPATRGKPSAAEETRLKGLVGDERYYSDAVYRKQVDDEYKRAYAPQPAGPPSTPATAPAAPAAQAEEA